MSWCCSWSTGKREITMDVREVGAVEYTFVPVPPLNSSGWTAQRVPRKLNELQFPLYAISKNEKVSAQGLERGPGWTGTSYLVHVPGGTIDGARVVPYVIDLALDNRGRIRSAGELVPELAAKGHQGKAPSLPPLTSVTSACLCMSKLQKNSPGPRVTRAPPLALSRSPKTRFRSSARLCFANSSDCVDRDREAEAFFGWGRHFYASWRLPKQATGPSKTPLGRCPRRGPVPGRPASIAARRPRRSSPLRDLMAGMLPVGCDGGQWVVEPFAAERRGDYKPEHSGPLFRGRWSRESGRGLGSSHLPA